MLHLEEIQQVYKYKLFPSFLIVLKHTDCSRLLIHKDIIICEKQPPLYLYCHYSLWAYNVWSFYFFYTRCFQCHLYSSFTELYLPVLKDWWSLGTMLIDTLSILSTGTASCAYGLLVLTGTQASLMFSRKFASNLHKLCALSLDYKIIYSYKCSCCWY